MKVLFIGYDFLLENNRRLLNEITDFPKNIQIKVLVPHLWKERTRNNSLIEFEGSRPENYEITTGHIMFAGRDSVHFYYSGLLKTILSFKPDVIYVWQEPWSLVLFQVTIIKSFLMPQCKIVFRTSETAERKRALPFRIIERYNFMHSSCAVAITHNAKQVLADKGYEKHITVTPHAIDIEFFRPKDSKHMRKRLGLYKTVIGYIGAFTKQKGIETLIDSFAWIQNAQLLLVGDGPHKEEIEEKIHSIGLQERVVMVPKIAHYEVPDYMSCIDIFVLPSISIHNDNERFGRVLIEAMACGVPVIGSSSGEIPNVIGQEGLIFEEGNEKDLSEKLSKLLNDPAYRKFLGEKGKFKAMSSFSWVVILKKTIDILDSITSDKSAILYVAAGDWSYLYQRYQHLSSRLAKEFTVVYIESLGLRDPSLKSTDIIRIFKRLFRFFGGLRKVKDNLYVFSPVLIPWQKNAVVQKINCFFVTLQLRQIINRLDLGTITYWTSIPTKLCLALKSTIGPKVSIYDCPDDYSTISGAPEDILDTERKIIESFDITFVTAQKLYDQKETLGRQVHHIGNGADIEHYNTVLENFAVPNDVKGIPKPIVCFAGAIYDWVDTELLDYATGKVLDCSWLFIGPVRAPVPFKNRKNVFFLERKPYDELPHYLNHADVCIMPYKQNKHMQSADPIIMYEYLTMGKPVVSTDFPETEKFKGLMYIAQDRDGFVECVNKAVGTVLEQNDSVPAQLRKEKVKEYCWDSLVHKIYELIANYT